MFKTIRLNEYKVFLYRIGLAYLFYFIARVLFYLYNKDLIEVSGIGEFLKLAYHGLTFDTPAILYVNSLFILLSLFPLFINTNKKYQKTLFYLYFITNLIAYATNYIDFIYYKIIYSRTTTSVLNSMENETNLTSLFLSFFIDYWHVVILFIIAAWLWVFLYKKVTVKPFSITHKSSYVITSIIFVAIVTTLSIGGIRGDFKHSTRPITLVDANRHVKIPTQGDIVLNTPFSIIRTIGKNNFKKENFVDTSVIENTFHPIKTYKNDTIVPPKTNVVLFILESYGREYIGAFNKNRDIKNYESFSPFLDSLAQHSLVFTNGFPNGRKSIHGMSSVLAGIPSFKVAFTSSSYSKQPIQSVVSAYNEMGYDTSFFHSAPNGSMGFLGFSNILGFDHYYGKTEYDNKYKGNDDFDGFWGIWDEPFFQYMKEELDQKEEPFMATIFTVSSHSPYIIPEKYEDKFPKGYVDMHQCVGYTDYALKRFFEEAKKQPWFKNTVFAFTADHGNQVHYDYYKKALNRNTVPIMFYYPRDNSILLGNNNELAQQIDIYPTLLDISGYNKPFRSWGRSLVSDTLVKPFVMSHTSKLYQFMQGNYICIFDGNKSVGFYDINDKGLNHNLIANKNEEMLTIETACKAFIQDYMDRIIDRKLSVK